MDISCFDLVAGWVRGDPAWKVLLNPVVVVGNCRIQQVTIISILGIQVVPWV